MTSDLVPKGVQVTPQDHMYACASYCHNLDMYNWFLQNGEGNPSATSCLMACSTHTRSKFYGDDRMLLLFLENGFFADVICWASKVIPPSVDFLMLFQWSVIICNNVRALEICNSACSMAEYPWRMDILFHDGLHNLRMHSGKDIADVLKTLTDSFLEDLVRHIGGPSIFINALDLRRHYYNNCDRRYSLSQKREYVKELKFAESYADKLSCIALHRWCIDQMNIDVR